MQTLKPFHYIEPGSVEEAVGLLSDYGEQGTILAGGVDLIPRMRQRKALPENIVSIQKIPGLNYIKDGGEDGVKFGALTTIRSIEISPAIRKEYTILYEAAHQLPSVQIKSMGTIVGNLCVGTPASDMATSLLALGAELKVASEAGERIVPIEDFYAGVGQTVLEPDEMVLEVTIPGVASGTGGSYQHLVRTRADISKVCVGVCLKVEDDLCKDITIALGSVAPTVIRAKRAEAALKDKKLGEGIIAETAQIASDETKPITDLRSTAEYRKEATRVLVKRALNRAFERAKAN
jgi:carbon-monoxide dehydrogenase medium subunit